MNLETVIGLVDEYKRTGIMPVQINYGTPAVVTPEILAACRQISPNYIPCFLDVTPLPDCEVCRCYGNADKYVIRYGGKRVEGWDVFTGWEGRYAVFYHHAIWQKPDGTYVDLTPNDGEEDRILFLPHGRRHLEGRAVPRRFVAISTDQETLDLLKYYRYFRTDVG